MDEANLKEAFVNFVFTEGTISAKKMRKHERKRLAHAHGELKIQFYNPSKIDNFSIPTKILRKRIMKDINVHVMRVIDKQLTRIEEEEYELMDKFPYTGTEEDRIKFRVEVLQKLSVLYAKQARHLDEHVLPVLEEAYRVNTKKIWDPERITRFRYRQKGEASLWAAVYRSCVYAFPFRTKENSGRLGIYGEEETGEVSREHEQTYYSRDLLKIGLPKAFGDFDVLAEYIQKNEIMGVPGQRLHVRVGMQVTLTVNLDTKDSMTGVQRMVERGVRLTIVGFRDNNDCIVAEVQQGLHEGKYVEIRRKKTFALFEEVRCALQRLQFPIKRTPDSEIIFTAKDFIGFAGTGKQDDVLRNEVLQETATPGALGLPSNISASPDHEEISEINLAIKQGIYYQLRQIEYDEYGMIMQFPFSGNEEEVTDFKKWVNVRMERLYKSQREEMERMFENEIQYQDKTDVLKVWDSERIQRYKFRQGGGSEWILRHGQKFYNFRIRNIDGSICRYEATILSGINTGKVAIVTRQPSFAHFEHLGCALLRRQFPIRVDD